MATSANAISKKLAIVIQIISSATNGFLIISISVISSSEEFGSFSIAYAIMAFVLGTFRSLAFDFMLISTKESQYHSNPLQLIIILAVPVTLFFLLVNYIFFSFNNKYLTIMSLVVLVVLIQDFGRYLAFSENRNKEALKSDLVWLLLSSFCFILPITGPEKLACWGGACAFAVWANGVMWNTEILREIVNSKLSAIFQFNWKYALEFSSLSGRGFLLIIALTSSHGLQAVAYLTLVQYLFQPLGAVVQGARYAYLQTIGKINSSGGHSGIVEWLLFITVSCVVWTFVVIVLGDSEFQHLLGSTFQEAGRFIIWLAIFQWFRLMEIRILDQLKSTGQDTKLFKFRSISFFAISVLSAIIYSIDSIPVDQAFQMRAFTGVLLTGVFTYMLLRKTLPNV